MLVVAEAQVENLRDEISKQSIPIVSALFSEGSSEFTVLALQVVEELSTYGNAARAFLVR